MEGQTEIPIRKPEYAADNQVLPDYTSSTAFNNPIPLEYILDEETTLRRLADLGVKDTAQLWMPIALDYVLGQSIGMATLKRLAYCLSSRCSPFKPSYRVDHNYSISIEMELSTDSLNWINSIDSELCKATFSAEIELPTVIIRSKAELSLPADELVNMRGEIADLVPRLTQSLVECQYETSPATLDSNSISAPVKVKLLTEILDTLKKPSKGYLDNRLPEVVIRRYGLLSGKTETLEDIAKDLDGTRDLTRERVRQLEDKALKLIHTRKRLGVELFSTLQEFKEQIRLWLSTMRHVAHAEELLDHFKRYIDFDVYEPFSSMFFLCNIAGLSVKKINRNVSDWFVATSDFEYERFTTAYKMLTNSSVDEAGMATETLVKRVRELHEILSLIDLECISAIRLLTHQVIGPSKIMPYDEFILSLRRRFALDKRLEELSRYIELRDMGISSSGRRLICQLSGVTTFSAAEYERMLFGEWISNGLTERAQDIAQAIIYSGASEGPPGSQVKPAIVLKQGRSSEQIVNYLANRMGHEMSEQALDELCRRNPDVFIRTGARSWGLIGAGAELNETGEENQLAIRYRITDCMADILHDSPDGLSFAELIREVRRIIPSAAEQTIRLYLTTLQPERFQSVGGDKFKLRREYVDFLENRINLEPTIDVVTRVLGEAEAPLSIKEIIRRCEEIQFVSHTAIRGYLSQNYGGRFRRLNNGKYTIA